MNQKVGRSDHQGVGGLGTPLDVLRPRSDFRGPVRENEDGEHANDHIALVYENRDEQFSTVIPFIREGLEWGERCLYIADENTREVVLEAMRTRGIDVDAALDSGALSFHTPAETYRKTGEFDRDAMLAYWEDTLEEATGQNDFNGVRAAAEMTWALEDDTDLDLLTEYEAILNSLYEGEAYTVMCQYDRDRFPAEVLRDVVETHPHIVSGDTVSRNFYYTPPERFFGPERPDDDLDRMLETLRDRTQAKAALEERQQYLRKSYEITSDPELSFEEKLDSLFELGCERFDLELGGLARIDPDTDLFEVEAVSGDHDHLEPSAQVALSETYCRVLGEADETAGVTDPVADGFDGTLAYDEFGVKSYLGTRIELEDDFDRSLFFVSSEPRDTGFSEAERTFHHLMGQWVQYELEREKRESALQRTKENFEQVFENSHDAILIVDVDADELVEANPATCEMLGYSRDELLSRRPSDLHPDELDKFYSFTGRVFEDGAGWTDELTCQSKDRGRIPTEISASRIEYDDREAMLAIVRDISDRKERERRLRQAERQFEATFNNPVSFVGLLDPDGTVRRINENALEFADVEEADVRGEKFWDTPWFEHSEEVRAELREGIASAADGEYVNAEIPHRSPDGETVIMDSMLEPVLNDDDEVVAIVPSGHDITELRERERFQRRLYEIAADTDRSFEEKLQAVFELGCELFDLEFGGIARVDVEDDFFQVEALSGDHEHLVPGEQYPLSKTYCRLVTRDGEMAGVTDPAASGFDDEMCYEQFGVEAYIGTYLQIEGDDDRTFFFLSNEPREAAFSEAERTFHHLMGQWVQYELERRQNERALEETVTQLQQSNDRLKQFAYAASHDLQEPLRMVSSYLQLLDDRYSDQLDEDAREFIDFAVDGADRMRAMVDDLLAYSRVDQSEGAFEPVDCDALLADVLDDLQVRIEENDATVDVDSLPTVSGDREQLEQLFSNLVSNAVKYNDSETPRVNITATRREDSWEFAVADDGIGIAADKRDRIFEVFKRLHHDDEYPGTGIGLSLCQEIVENHGGEIWVESEPGVGSTFSFTLPGCSET